jgi:gibberellin 2beta-dioxygenase
MVVLTKGELEQIALPAVQRASPPPPAAVPEVDLAAGDAAAARAVARACEDHGFFKVTGHGVPPHLLARLEAAAAAFFALPQREKDRAAGCPFGYASKRIGANGDLGWVEYLLLAVTAAGAAAAPGSACDGAEPSCFRSVRHPFTLLGSTIIFCAGHYFFSVSAAVIIASFTHVFVYIHTWALGTIYFFT